MKDMRSQMGSAQATTAARSMRAVPVAARASVGGGGEMAVARSAPERRLHRLPGSQRPSARRTKSWPICSTKP
jgi:hypothetical protein